MVGHWAEVDDGDEIRQGDIIRRLSFNGTSAEWGFVITADCDIVQKKAGDRFTYIEIVHADRYLETVWAPEQLRRLIDRQSKAAAEQLSGIMKRSMLPVEAVSSDILLTWLTEQSVQEIVAAVNKTGKPIDDRLTRMLDCLQSAVDTTEAANLSRFKNARGALGDSSAKIAEALKTAFEGERGFPDFFMIPEMPHAAGVGYIVMLRAFKSVETSDLFLTELDARISGKPNAFHRIGRLKDGFRFAVMQKLAFLFMRIGLARSFEQACISATELVVENLMGEAGA